MGSFVRSLAQYRDGFESAGKTSVAPNSWKMFCSEQLFQLLCTCKLYRLRYAFVKEVLTLQGETQERWRELCNRAALEQDPKKLLDLAAEINRLLKEKEQRLQQRQSARDAH